MIKKTVNKFSGELYFVFRVLIGLLFMQHGVQKLFGGLGSKGAADIISLMGAAGIIEFFGGLLIVLGLFTRLVVLISAVEMIVAFVMSHAPRGLIPIMNGGELAALYFAAFLVLIAYGNGMWNLEYVLAKKEIF